ncbi:hypothetical protein KAI04_05065 [Candidatus Pacearchaeota archaeon]|nr:hypothetical protein [Candidatus Pacearchaeota archaeon]
MVREDILGGLRTASARGQTLRQSMMSFYNAGYLKEEIEEAAKVLQAEKNKPIQNQFAPGPAAPIFQRSSSVGKDPNEKPKEILSQTAKLTPTQSAKPQTIQKVSAYGQPAQVTKPITKPTQPVPVKQPVQVQPVKTQTIQKASAYVQPTQTTQPAKPKGKTIIFVLLAMLIILIGGLIAVFFFKNEILSFFGSV